MVPIYKKWEASLARVQIVRQEKVVQMLAFFGDFQHGTCMNFVLKGTDIMESFGRSGKFGIRMVDAKFALPKKDDNPASNFVCLDMPEYPIEHDDLTVTFDTEACELYLSFDTVLPLTLSDSTRKLQGSPSWISTRTIPHGLYPSIIHFSIFHVTHYVISPPHPLPRDRIPHFPVYYNSLLDGPFLCIQFKKQT
jgi:hypothetical protein